MLASTITTELPNTDVYKLVSSLPGPVTLAVMKDFLKITSTADDALIQSMLDAATEWGEKVTGRDFRAITWDLLLDCFATRIPLRRDPVASIAMVEHLVDAALVTVPSAIFYLKKLVQSSEILLNEGKDWPTDTDNREQVIKIRFVTEGFRCQDSIKEAIQRHVALWYRNRGDCADVEISAKRAGVNSIYGQFTVQRF